MRPPQTWDSGGQCRAKRVNNCLLWQSWKTFTPGSPIRSYALLNSHAGSPGSLASFVPREICKIDRSTSPAVLTETVLFLGNGALYYFDFLAYLLAAAQSHSKRHLCSLGLESTIDALGCFLGGQ